jgi:uncharacterized protein (TIRG00374 family)
VNRLSRILVLSAAAGAAIYVALAAWFGWHKVAGSLAAFSWSAAAVGAGLAAVNYGLRFLKWEFYLWKLGVRVPRGRSLAIFLSGFSLTVTPGKVGEVLKSYLLRETDGVEMARSAPIVVAERVTDLISLLLLALLGAGALGSSQKILWVGAAFVGTLILFVAVRPLGELAIRAVAALPGIGKRIAPKLAVFYQSTRELLGPGALLVATAISVAAWACECAAFYFILRGFPGVAVELRLCTFIYAAMTVAGALSFLPGGLGVQEGGMVKLLCALAPTVGEATAFAATFVTRICTLWFAVAVGLVALAFVRRGVNVDLAALRSANKSL